MEIYTVREGDTLYHIGRRYGISPERLAADNGITAPDRLPVGENLLIVRPGKTVTVREGETLFSIAERYGTDVMTLWQLNPFLGGSDQITAGDVLTVRSSTPRGSALTVGGYVRPDQSDSELRAVLPYLTTVAVSSAYIDRKGGIRVPEATSVIETASRYRVSPILAVTDEGGSAGEESLRHLLGSPEARTAFAEALTDALTDNGYSGAELSFPLLPPGSATGYQELLRTVRELFLPLGLSLTVAVSPRLTKDAEERRILLRAAGEYADLVRLVAFDRESMGDCRPISPIGETVRELSLCLEEIPRHKVTLCLALYGYDRTVTGNGRTENARSVSPSEAITMAFIERTAIRYDCEAEESFYSYYVPESGRSERHDVWFRDIRGAAALMRILDRLHLSGIALYPTYTPYPPILLYLASLYRIALAPKK